MEPFYNNEDARRRLQSSILFYKGVPCVLSNVGGADYQVFTLSEAQLGTSTTTIKYTDNDLTDVVPRLGYVNHNKKAYYLSRVVVRDQRAGLPIESLNVHDGHVPSGLIYSDSMEDMLLNKYPSLQEAYNNMCNKWESCAFSKGYAIDYELHIHHAGRVIGRLIKSPYGFEIEYSPYLKKLSFYMRNFGDRYSAEVRSLI